MRWDAMVATTLQGEVALVAAGCVSKDANRVPFRRERARDALLPVMEEIEVIAVASGMRRKVHRGPAGEVSLIGRCLGEFGEQQALEFR